MDWLARQRGRSAVLTLFVYMITWGMLVSTAVAAEFGPPRPLPHKPVSSTLNIAYSREVSGPDGFQVTGSFDCMYLYAGNEVLVAIGRDGVFDPAESQTYAYDFLDDGKRYRFHLRQGVQFRGAPAR
jgi:ABC-type transport system substrate-binding protein